MPPKYLKDIKGAGWRHLSFFHNISNVRNDSKSHRSHLNLPTQALYLHTSVGDLYTADSSQRMVDVIKRGLNPQLREWLASLPVPISDAA